MSAFGDSDPLAPYVPRLVADWLADEYEVTHRGVSGTFVFADVSGFTKLTERLAARGKAGAEEMGGLLNVLFEDLLTAAYDYGASLLKWGGDAVLLLFDGDEHPLRGTRGAWGMQQIMRRIGRVQTSRGAVRLGISIGVHTGDVDFLLVGRTHRELIVTGPDATTTARMEKVAGRGQVVVSPSTAALLPAGCVGAAVGPGLLLTRAPQVVSIPNRMPKRSDVDLGQAMCAHLRDHLRGDVEDEHRSTTIGFIRFAGADDLLAKHGPEALSDAVADIVIRTQEAADANGVTFLASDLNENGGKLILTSGVPIATGDAETRMLSTLHRVVRSDGPLALTGGITSGGVFAGDYGPFYRKTYSIAGDAVNLAARLMAAAEPGQILATPTVVERSRSTFETTPLPPFFVKGKAAPVEAVLIGGPRRANERAATDRPPLVGRDAELAHLLAAAERAGRGRGGVVEIVADPGLGKSRLIEELADRVSAPVMWVDGDIYGRVTPYQPMQRLLRNSLALPADVDDLTLAATLTDLVAAAAPDLAPWLPLVGIVAGVDLPATPETAILDPEVRRARLEAAISELLGRLLTTPIVLVFNDVQFMDEATTALIGRLAADVGPRPWLIIVSRRPDCPSPVTAEHVSIALAPLDADAAARLFSDATDEAPLPSHQMRRLVERADGNPLFLRQLIAAARSGADIDHLPDSIEGTIVAQIDQLPPRRRRWLRAVSVLGMTVEPDLLAAVLEGTELADESCAGLETFISMRVDGRLQFAHHLVRLTAYESLPYRRRIELHARAADALEVDLGERAEHAAELLSLHCLRGEKFASAWHYSRVAGDVAREAFAPAQAVECYRRALDAAQHLPDLSEPELAGVYEVLAQCTMDLGETEQAEWALRRARARAKDDPYQLARLMLHTARHRQHIGRHADGLRWVTRGRRLLHGAETPAAARKRAELAEVGALIRYDQGAYRTAAIWARRCVAEARAAADPLTEARGLGVSAVLAALTGQRVDDREVREALARYDESRDLRGKARTANVLGMCAYFDGRWNEAMDYYALAEDAFTQIGFDIGTATTAANRAEILVQQGRVDEAAPALDAAIRTLLAVNATSFVSFALVLRGRVALGRRDFDAAMNDFGEARTFAVEMGETDEVLTIDALAAECLLRSGDPAAAMSFVDDALVRAGRAETEASATPLLYRVRGEALVMLGQIDDGHTQLRRALAEARRRDAQHDVEATLATLARLAAGDATEVRGWADERARLADRLGIVRP